MIFQPECKISSDGTKCWYLNGKLHRTDGPAVEWADRSKFWYLNDQLHRTDGPAIECADGPKYWYLNGKWLDPGEAFKDPELYEKYPKLIESMVIYGVHDS